MGARRAVIRTAASRALGHGHLHRCLALADALASAGVDVAFAVNDAAVAAAAGLWGKRFPTVAVEPGDGIGPAAGADLAAEIARTKAAFGGGIDWLIVDHYRRDAEFERLGRDWARGVLAIDDLGRAHDADIVLDASPGRRVADYADTAPRATCLCGPAFALLKPEFSIRRPASCGAGDARALLVSIGGTDPAGILPVLLAMLAPLRGEFAMTVAVGGATGHLDAITAVAADVSASLLVDCRDMAAVLARTGIAIGAGGVSALERCCLGVPSLLLQAADNQAGTIAELVRAGAAELLDWPVSGDALVEIVRKLAADGDRRARMADVGRRLCDGRGARRAAAVLASDVSDKSGQRLHLRPVTDDDTARIFGWQCSPGARRFSRNPRPPTWAEHLDWTREILRRPDTVYEIVMAGAEPVGVLRLEPGAERLEVSILVAPETGGKGVATGALHLARKLVPGRPLHAFIAPENLASRRAFEKAGFRPAATCNWYSTAASTSA